MPSWVYERALRIQYVDVTHYHYAADEMGSITHVIDGECVLNHYTYDAWGVPTVCKETVENRFRFNGQQYDPVSRQYYMRARFYNPVIARFTQEDSYRGDGLNLYSYCENNPVYYIDPSGHYVCASGVKRRTEDVRRRTATRDEYKSLSSHLREKLRNGKPLTPSEKAAAENLGINVNRKRSKSGTDSWNMVEGGGTINGREYSQHAMERMAPDTPQVRAELSRRAEKAATQRGLKVETQEYYEYCKKYVDPRNIPPSVIEEAISSTKGISGKIHLFTKQQMLRLLLILQAK